MKNSEIYKRITNSENIYKAIYSMESFVFEKYLLSDEDLLIYERLKDKFDDEYIDEYILRCKERLEKILIEDELFNCKVFFQAKKINDSRIEFRPIHTASLQDQICMVVLLSPLMFDDLSGVRKLSAISRLLPANFYGNIPSGNVKELFKPWHKQYSEYTADTLTANMEYIENHKYKYELCLDLKRFFPSINPVFIYNYILNKWPISADENDIECIKKILAKLLFLNTNIKKELYEFYYPKDMLKYDNLEFNVGIAQGLPQGYFFGNICMSIIANQENKIFKGDSYFYVDDSVVYTNEKVNKEVIEKLENEIENVIADYLNKDKFKITKLINTDLLRFHKSAKDTYVIKIHEIGKKSEFKEISKIDSLFFLAKPASLIPFEIRTAQDEFEDKTILEKIKALISAIDILILDLKKDNEGEIKDKTLLKRLNRYSKFYKNRENNLNIAISDSIVYDKKKVNEFIDYYQLNKSPLTGEFFKLLDSKVFCFESQIIAKQLSCCISLRDEFLNCILSFENSCLNLGKRSNYNDSLYFYKVLSTISNERRYPNNKYTSLEYGRLTQEFNSNNKIVNQMKINNIEKIVELVKLNNVRE